MVFSKNIVYNSHTNAIPVGRQTGLVNQTRVKEFAKVASFAHSEVRTVEQATVLSRSHKAWYVSFECLMFSMYTAYADKHNPQTLNSPSSFTNVASLHTAILSPSHAENNNRPRLHFLDMAGWRAGGWVWLQKSNFNINCLCSTDYVYKRSAHSSLKL